MTRRKSDNPSRLIVGCGYLGQRVARRWIQSGSTVFATTRSAANADILSSENILPIIGDVTAAEGSPEILQESSHDLSNNSGDPDADTESEGIQEAIDPWGDIDTDFTSLPEKEIQAIKSFSKEVLKETAEEDQEKEEEEITDKDLDIENIDNLLAKTNRFLVVSKRNAEKAEEEQEKEEGEITDDDSDNENIDNLLAKTRNRFIVDSERNENSVGKQNPVKNNINNTKTATWKMVDGKVKILSDTR